MDAILAARRIGLFIQHLIPLAALFGDLVPEFSITLGGDRIEQQFQSRPYRTDDTKRRRRAPSEYVCPVINLDDGAFVREEFRIRIVGAEHQQQIAVHDRVYAALVPIMPMPPIQHGSS